MGKKVCHPFSKKHSITVNQIGQSVRDMHRSRQKERENGETKIADFCQKIGMSLEDVGRKVSDHGSFRNTGQRVLFSVLLYLFLWDDSLKIARYAL
ncbi:hypothetical protein CEXT_761881 [Caerostris extrusa]|uniref:Uncharacterized protein n=1 Tax=Caerostris extrusa TaxID=172846 RepID=A0AAV4MRE8_CAEEX|nr:hypothetical protein CEXT_761881 [Caerostris extrusa]